jgi:hypothetical protein
MDPRYPEERYVVPYTPTEKAEIVANPRPGVLQRLNPFRKQKQLADAIRESNPNTVDRRIEKMEKGE